MLSATAFMAILLISFNALKKNINIVNISYIVICVSYIRYFGISYNSYVDMAVLLSFIVFSMFYFTGSLMSRKGIVCVLNKVWLNSQSETNNALDKKYIKISNMVILSFVLLAMYVNVEQVGSIEMSFVKMYNYVVIGDVSPWLLRLKKNIYWLCIAIVFLRRFNSHTTKGNDNALIPAIALSLTMFSEGSVGLFLAPIVFLIWADVVFSVTYYNRIKIGKSLIIIMFVSVVLSAGLLVIRERPYSHVGEVYNYYSNISSRSFSGMYEGIMYSHRSVLLQIDAIMKMYGESYDYLHYHTLYSIAVNWVPRELWMNKPISFGRVLAIQGMYYTHDLVSGPTFAAGLAGEGYANDGYVGIVVLSSIVGVLCGLAAKIALVIFSGKSIVLYMLGMILIRFSTLYVRGDILSAWSSTAYPIILLLSIMVVIKVFKKHLWKRA